MCYHGYQAIDNCFLFRTDFDKLEGININLSERIKKQRKMLKMTQNDMAMILGVHRATYGEYELGNNQPPIDKLIKMADIFDVSTDYLLGRERVQATDVGEILARTLKLIENDETVKFENKTIPQVTNQILRTSLETTLTLTKLSIKD